MTDKPPRLSPVNKSIIIIIIIIILECEDYAILLVDTQVIDSISVSENVAINLMTTAALLNLYFIYNSKRFQRKTWKNCGFVVFFCMFFLAKPQKPGFQTDRKALPTIYLAAARCDSK